MTIRNIEIALEGMYNYIASNINTYVAQVNADITDGYTIGNLECAFNPIIDFDHANTLIFYSQDGNFTGGMPNTPPIQIDFVIQIKTVGTDTSIGNTINKLQLRYLDALNNLFNVDCTLGHSCDSAGIKHYHAVFEPSTGLGFLDFYCSAQIWPSA